MKDFWTNEITFKKIKGQDISSPMSFLVPLIGFINILNLPEFIENILTPVQKKPQQSWTKENKVFLKR
jgi:hypothetical protein